MNQPSCSMFCRNTRPVRSCVVKDELGFLFCWGDKRRPKNDLNERNLVTCSKKRFRQFTGTEIVFMNKLGLLDN